MTGASTKWCLIRIVAAVGAVAASVAGCSASPARSSAPTAPGEAAPIKITLSYQPSGTAALSWDRQSQTVTAKLQMGGFTPGRTYAVDIYKGSCATTRVVAVPFPKVTADGGGAINTTLTGERLAPGGLVPDTAFVIHPDAGDQAGAATEAGYAPLACAEILAANAEATLAVAPVGPRPEGWATVTSNPGNKTLVIATWASGLAPGSPHAQHIGPGTCESRETPKYALRDLVASANGTVYETSVIEDVDQSLLSSAWYLNVQLGSSAQLIDNGRSTPYDAPIICGSTGKSASTS